MAEICTVFGEAWNSKMSSYQEITIVCNTDWAYICYRQSLPSVMACCRFQTDEVELGICMFCAM